MYYPNEYDVIVVGGGHAGTEAALASARMGCMTLLVTHNIETLGQMSCNPAIGGIGKGHLVKEIDALDGAMAAAADDAGIHFRILNSSKGHAVRATRAQVDRWLYKKSIRGRLETQKNLTLLQLTVEDIAVTEGRVTGIVGHLNVVIRGKNIVLTAGTFLDGVVHVGLSNFQAGRMVDPSSICLAHSLRELMLPVGRLKTGTPPRIDRNTINFKHLVEQKGDHPPPVFSFLGTAAQHPQQVSCWITHTSETTHSIIRAALDRSPLFSGIIESVGPRYCPSIEDKVVRFVERTSHQIFVEPEGLHTTEVYPNGISTSLPFDVQINLVRSIKGFESAHITRPGYAIEYDFFDPRGLKFSLETKKIRGLFFAGQINGTTGYEEAAAQGLLAGINAALRTQGKSAWCPPRDQAYLGVMVDDLVTRGITEPYRMFTSRAEYRLSLREDNADLRLTEHGHKLGVVGEDRWRHFAIKRETILKEQARLRAYRIGPRTINVEAAKSLFGKPLEREYSLYDLLRRPEVSYDKLMSLFDTDITDPKTREQVEIQAKYQGYIDRQQEEIMRYRHFETLNLPEDIDYQQVHGLSTEVQQKLNQHKPETLGQAARISGVTPAAISLLLVYLKRRRLNIRERSA